MLCGPAACGCCGHDLTGEPVLGTPQKRQVFEASPSPPPAVTEYQVAAKQCPECGEISVGRAPAGVTGRVQCGPGVQAKAALAVCAHHLPVARAARLGAALTGVNEAIARTSRRLPITSAAASRNSARSHVASSSQTGSSSSASGSGSVPSMRATSSSSDSGAIACR